MTAARCWDDRPLAPWPPSRGGRRHGRRRERCAHAGKRAGAEVSPSLPGGEPRKPLPPGPASWASCGRHGHRGWLTDAEARCFIRFDVLCPVERVTRMLGGVCLQLVSRSRGERSRVPALPLAHGMRQGVQSHPGGSAGAEGLGGDPKGRKPPLSFRGGELGLC